MDWVIFSKDLERESRVSGQQLCNARN